MTKYLEMLSVVPNWIVAFSCCWYSADTARSLTLSDTSNDDGMSVAGLNVIASHDSDVDTLINVPLGDCAVNNARSKGRVMLKCDITCLMMVLESL